MSHITQSLRALAGTLALAGLLVLAPAVDSSACGGLTFWGRAFYRFDASVVAPFPVEVQSATFAQEPFRDIDLHGCGGPRTCANGFERYALLTIALAAAAGSDFEHVGYRYEIDGDTTFPPPDATVPGLYAVEPGTNELKLHFYGFGPTTHGSFRVRVQTSDNAGVDAPWSAWSDVTF